MTRPMSGRVPSAADGVVLFTPAEAGDRIRASEATVYRLIADGVLRTVDIARPGAKKPKTRVRSDDLNAYIDERTRDPRSAA